MGWLGKSEAQKRNVRRREVLESLKTAARDGDSQGVFDALFSLNTGGLDQDPEVPWAVVSAVNTIALRDLKEGFHLAIYGLNIMTDPDILSALAEKTFTLMGRVDNTNLKMVASVAMAANLIVTRSATDSEHFRRGIKAWHGALEVLSAKQDGLSYAFAAASNAALGNAQPALQPMGRDTWAKIVMELATRDPAAARQEAQRVAHGYGDFGADAAAFKARAHSVLSKIKP